MVSPLSTARPPLLSVFSSASFWRATDGLVVTILACWGFRSCPWMFGNCETWRCEFLCGMKTVCLIWWGGVERAILRRDRDRLVSCSWTGGKWFESVMEFLKGVGFSRFFSNDQEATFGGSCCSANVLSPKMCLFLLWKTSHDSIIESDLVCRLIFVQNRDVFWSVKSREWNYMFTAFVEACFKYSFIWTQTRHHLFFPNVTSLT